MNSRKVRFVKKILISLSMACCVNFNVQGMNNGTNIQQNFLIYDCPNCGNVNNPLCPYCQARFAFGYQTKWPYEFFDYIYSKWPDDNIKVAVNKAINVKESYDYLAKIYGLNANPSLQDLCEYYISTGSYGSVFKVKDKNENKDKVIKLCFYDNSNFDNQKNWILSESSLLAELQAIGREYKEKSQYLSIPSFVGIYDKSRYKIESKHRNNFEGEKNSNRSEKIKDNSFVDRESKFLVSEYEKADCDLVDFYEKGNLKSLCGKSASAFLKKLYIEVLTGLSVLHKSGLVHGDIKSDNILMSSKDKG